MSTDTNPMSGLDPLLSIDELAEYLGVPIKTNYEWRQTGRGPVCIRMGRHPKFAVPMLGEAVRAKQLTLSMVEHVADALLANE